jgi:hypothetical protein
MKVPLTRLIPVNVLPEPVRSLFEAVEIVDFTVDLGDGFTDASVIIQPSGDDPRIEIGGPEGCALVFRELATLNIHVEGALEISIGLAELTIELPSFLRPAREENGRWVPIADQRQTVTLRSAQGGLRLRWHSEEGYGFVWPADAAGVPDIPVFSLSETMLGETRIVISADAIDIRPDPDNFALSFIEAAVILPEEFPSTPNLIFRNCRIDSHGFTGIAEASWNDGSAVGQLFGYPDGQLNSVLVEFKDSLLIGAEIEGKLVIPYFSKSVDVSIALKEGGHYLVTLRATDPVSLKREGLVELQLSSLTLGADPGIVQMKMSGALEPLLMSSDGMQWPRLEVTDLSIDSNGKFSIKEAWLDLKEMATLDLFGFHFELRRIGLGSLLDAGGVRLWIDLSGGLRLIEQIPVGLDVEGFRLTWPQTLSLPASPEISDIQTAMSQVAVEFAGIDLSFGIPKAVEFEGRIRFFKKPELVGFAGDVALRVPASGFAAEAGLMVGLSFDPVYPFLYVYFGVELPAGIPLGQSGLALKGALGMFGLNVVPKKLPDQNWYYDWYKPTPTGAHPTDKWEPHESALALGVGITITTADGHVKGTRGLLVLSIPGPALIIEGRAMILSGLTPNAEPPFRALAVFDGGAGTVQFNVEAEATLVKDMFEAYGMLEAFFDFNDITNWHLYLGQKTPRSRRIRASILKLGGSFLFDADAYLMMDMVGVGTLRSRLGASITFEPKIPPVDPVEIEFAATLEGDGVLTARPEQFSGELELSAHIKLSAFGQSMRLSADALFLTEGVQPLKVGANVHVEAELPDPLDPLETTLELQWESLEQPAFESPLSEIDVSSRLSPSRVATEINQEPSFKIRTFGFPESGRALAEESPLVPADSQPIVGFRKAMNTEISSIAGNPTGEKFHYDVGHFQFIPKLVRIRLYEHVKGDPWHGTFLSDWRLPIASTDENDFRPLPAVWLAEPDPDSPQQPSPRRIQFWTDNPLSTTARALPGGSAQFLDAIAAGESLPERQLDDSPDLMKCIHTPPEPVCVDFESAEQVVIDAGESWEYEDLVFESTKHPIEVKTEEVVNLNWSEVGSPVVRSGIFSALLRFVRWLFGWLSRLLFVRRIFPNNRNLPGSNSENSTPSQTHACLFANGSLNISFRNRVREVRITLCHASEIKDDQLHAGLSPQQRIRTLEESRKASGDRKQPVPLKDWNICRVDVPFESRVDDDEWLIESDTDFDCLHMNDLGRFAIRKICYLTVAEIERSERAEQECGNNASLPVGELALQPGAYYRLEVETEVEGKLEENFNFGGGALGTMLAAAYESIIGDLTRTEPFREVCFFQTEGPPTNLRPYVKWSYPEHQAERFFYGDHLKIRFLRSNVKQMFASPFEIKLQIKDTQGNPVAGCTTTWDQAGSATLFTEESVWQDYRPALDWAAAPPPLDDILKATVTPVSNGLNLLPRTRYTLEVVRQPSDLETTSFWYFVVDYGNNDRRATNVVSASGPDVAVYYQVRATLGGFQGRLQGIHGPSPEMRFANFNEANNHRNARWASAPAIQLADPLTAVLYSSTFVTSAFRSFESLVQSYPGTPRLIITQADPQITAARKDLRQSTKRLAIARQAWEHAQVDYRFAELKEAKNGLEAARLEHREAAALHDEQFRILADKVGDLFFQPLAEHLELYLVRSKTNAGLICLWLRSPESLDFRLPVLQNVSSNQIVDHVGRTEFSLDFVSTLFSNKSSSLQISVLPNADGTQVLIFPQNQPWPQGKYTLKFHYHRNYGDETSSIDHRYDRPVESSELSPGTRKSVIKWSWK